MLRARSSLFLDVLAYTGVLPCVDKLSTADIDRGLVILPQHLSPQVGDTSYHVSSQQMDIMIKRDNEEGDDLWTRSPDSDEQHSVLIASTF